MMRVKIDKDMVARNIEGRWYIVDPRGRMLHTLNQTATFIFTLLKKEKDPDEIISRLCEEFDIAEENARKDLDCFLKGLKRKKIIKWG